MSYGLPWIYEQTINKAFAYICKNAPCFVYAKTKRNTMTEKRLQSTGTYKDMSKKLEVIKIYKEITKQDLLSEKFQAKFMRESITLNHK